jgi:hypothetical protein
LTTTDGGLSYHYHANEFFTRFQMSLADPAGHASEVKLDSLFGEGNTGIRPLESGADNQGFLPWIPGSSKRRRCPKICLEYGSVIYSSAERVEGSTARRNCNAGTLDSTVGVSPFLVCAFDITYSATEGIWFELRQPSVEAVGIDLSRPETYIPQLGRPAQVSHIPAAEQSDVTLVTDANPATL